jgi:rhomboid protease GluP
MLPMILFLAVVAGLFIRKLTPEERIQLVHTIVGHARRAIALARSYFTSTPPGCEEFYAALRERTKWALVTPALLAAYGAIYLVMIWGESSGSHEQLLLHWGGSMGPRTTNGEWWRLATAMFIHWGLLHLLADMAGLARAGVLVERLAGPTAFAFVYIAAGLIAGLRDLSAHPVAVSAGAAGAIFGVYGLLIATLVSGWIQRSPLTIPLGVLKGIWPGAVLFLVYNVVAEGFFTESMTSGLVVGLVGGGILALRIGSHKPPVPRLCATTVVAFGIVVAFAVPLRGMADVTREMARVIDLEKRTSNAYYAEVVRFRNGRKTASALADVAEGIAAEVRDTQASLAALTNVPRQHQPMLDDALEYLRLREESWRLRVEGLRAGRMPTLLRAERVESDAKTIFSRVEKLKGEQVDQ